MFTTTLIIFIFSIVQSIFGVGLLVFGTPTLVLMGKSYEEALIILLPCSLFISYFQILNAETKVSNFKNKFMLLTIPTVAIGLLLIFKLNLSANISKLLGPILIFTAILKFNPKFHHLFTRLLRKYETIFLMLMGIVHGISNMGGGLLSMYASSTSKNKKESLEIISFAYFIFSSVQIALLIFLGKAHFSSLNIFYILISFSCYIVIGQRLFNKASELVYQKILSYIIFFYGLVLILK